MQETARRSQQLLDPTRSSFLSPSRAPLLADGSSMLYAL